MKLPERGLFDLVLVVGLIGLTAWGSGHLRPPAARPLMSVATPGPLKATVGLGFRPPHHHHRLCGPFMRIHSDEWHGKT